MKPCRLGKDCKDLLYSVKKKKVKIYDFNDLANLKI
jgi:hypothetical protein